MIARCPICGLLKAPHSHDVVVNDGNMTMTFTFYVSNSTEPVCLGHPKPKQRVTVPQAFYDAFKDEEDEGGHE